MPKAFISYSYDSPEHKKWVMDFASRLREDGVETILDRWELEPGDQLPAFMERAVRDNDFVLIVCTPRYKERSDGRTGGVGFEEHIMTAEALTVGNQRKFKPVLRSGEWREAAPTWLKAKIYVDLCGEPYSEQNYEDLLQSLLGTRPKAPPVREYPLTRTPRSPEQNRIRIGLTDDYFEGPVYYLGERIARAARLLGAEAEEFPRTALDCQYEDVAYRLPPQIQEIRTATLDRLKREMEREKRPFYDGPCARLLRFHATPKDPVEKKHLTLKLAPIGWYDYSVCNSFVMEMLNGRNRARPSEFVNLARLATGDVEPITLSNILCTVTILFTQDGYLLYSRRGTWVSTWDGYFGGVDENIHRDKDLVNGRLDPFATVMRGVSEEVSPRLRERFTNNTPRLLGLSFGLDELSPALLFCLPLPLSCEGLQKIIREHPGPDFQEGRLFPLRVDKNLNEAHSALEKEPWEQSAKAAVIRTIEFLDALSEQHNETRLQTMQRLADETPASNPVANAETRPQPGPSPSAPRKSRQARASTKPSRRV